ncbi:MAG TPA: hypothetical protein VMY34_10490 [Acidimicrobiales bacterium]|nr:hypothetical protein [Acidimicrobiales bacterium]
MMVHWFRVPLAVALLTGGALAASPAPSGAVQQGFTPPIGTKAENVDLRTVAGSVPYGEGHAIPLKGERPSWYTPVLEQQVLAAQGAAVPAPLDAPLPSEVGIRPGGWIIAPYGCTANFVFQNGTALAIGTAGHCVDKRGESVVMLTLAPGTSNPVLVDIGTVAKVVNNGIGNDFALLTIRSVLYPWVSATNAVIGGPCGSYLGSGPETVTHYGHGLAIGTGGTPREGVALKWQTDAFGWDSPSIFGDSGSSVRVTDLKAAGDLTHLVVDTKWLPSFVAGTRITKMLQIAGAGWTLKNSPLCP